jgi:UrcA family protein
MLLALTTIAFAATNAIAIAQQKNEAPDVRIQAGKLERTIVGRSYTGIPIERVQLNLPVSYADLNLATPSGAAKLESRINDAAKEACRQLDTADPFDMSDMDTTSCIREAADGAMKQAKVAIAAAESNSATRTTAVN